MNIPYVIKDKWLVLRWAGIFYEVPTNPWGHPTHKFKWVKGALLIPGEILYPIIKILMEIHSTTPYFKEIATPHNPCIILGAKQWEEHKAPQAICHHRGSSRGHQTLCLSWQHLIYLTYTSWQMTPSITTYNGRRSHIWYQRTSISSMESKGRIQAPISPPTIFCVFQTLWWMIVPGYIFFPAPSFAT